MVCWPTRLPGTAASKKDTMERVAGVGLSPAILGICNLDGWNRFLMERDVVP
jgi:hypothetical protein